MTDNPIIPTITTSRLTLRPFAPSDANSFHRILNEPNILQYFPTTDAPDMERVQGMIERQLTHWEIHKYGRWVVVPNGQAEPIGWNGLQYLPETGEVEVGYLLSKFFWGQGFATEGAKASIDFGFERFNFGEIIGLTHPENSASQNVLKKCGMHFTEKAEYFGIHVFRFTLKVPIL